MWFGKTHQSLSSYLCTQPSDTTGCLLSSSLEFKKNGDTPNHCSKQDPSETKIVRWYHQTALIKEVKENKCVYANVPKLVTSCLGSVYPKLCLLVEAFILLKCVSCNCYIPFEKEMSVQVYTGKLGDPGGRPGHPVY